MFDVTPFESKFDDSISFSQRTSCVIVPASAVRDVQAVLVDGEKDDVFDFFSDDV